MDIASVAIAIESSGGRLYLVGGAVRDKLMNLDPKDLDYCVEGLSRTQFADLFPQAFMAGQSFPVFRMTVDGRVSEFALARTERKIGPGHTGFEMEANPDVRIEQDLGRRDLTVNAMAIRVTTHELVDPYHGQSDIQTRTLRAVSDAFCEDPLRAYRTARFAAQLAFRVDPMTLEKMNRLRAELLSLSVERVYEELKKGLKTKKPSLFFRILEEAQILDVHFPELSALIGVKQPAKYHPEGDAFEHTMQVLDAAAAVTESEEIRFAALVHDVGKGLTPPALWPSHRGHERSGVPVVQALCQRLKVPTSWTRSALFATEHHMKIHILHQMRPENVVDLLEAAHRNPLGVHGFSIVGLADIRGRNNPKAQDLNAEQMNSLWTYILKVANGKSIQSEKKGHEFGTVLRNARAKAVQAWRNQHQARP